MQRVGYTDASPFFAGLYSRTCGIHVLFSAACHRLAEYYRVVDKDLNKAVNLFEDTCLKKNFGESCFALGNMYIAGKGM